MLNTVTGVITAIDDQRIIINLGSLSLTLSVPQAHSFQINTGASLFTHLHWNAEQGPSLFGFATEVERTVFLMVIGCSGLGPKIALAVLEQLGPQAFIDALQTGNEGALSKVTGIGQKKAEQIVVQLRHKVAKLMKTGVVLVSSGSSQQWAQVSQALESLNYSRAEINQAMKYLGDSNTGQAVAFDQLMRQALSFLAKRT